MTDPVHTEIPYHLQQAIEAEPALDVEVFRGWSNDAEFSTPSVSILPGTLERTSRNNEVYDTARSNGEVTVFWRQANVTLPLTLVLYTESKTQRMNLVEPLRGLFHPDPPDKTSGPPPEGLQVTLDNHHGATARIFLRDDDINDQEAARDGLFRHDFDVVAETVELSKQTYDEATYKTNVSTN